MADSVTDFHQAFERVRNQVIMGNAHLHLWKGLSRRLRTEPPQLLANTAPTFFGLTLESHLDAAFLYAAKVFDTHRKPLTLWTILRDAQANIGSLSPEASNELSQVLLESDTKLVKLESSLKAVRIRRNKVIAHLDLDAVRNPDKVTKRSQISVDDLKNIFEVALEILNGVSGPYWGLYGSLKLLDVDDFERALDLIKQQKQNLFAEIKAEFPDMIGEDLLPR